MKLGIIVVYMVSEENESLLALHLKKIEQNTLIPYTIYAGVNNLSPKYRMQLEQHLEIQICECPATEFTGAREHSHYLEHLVKIAVEDGVSHIATLHLDSFPIRSGWAAELAGRLSESCAIVTLEHINTACLIFHRDFYLNYHPTFLLSYSELESPEYKEYSQISDVICHSGIGYGFKAYLEGFSCYFLSDSSGKVDDPFGRIYDDLIFHLQGAVRFVPESRNISVIKKQSYIQMSGRAVKIVKRIIPKSLKKVLSSNPAINVKHLLHMSKFEHSRKQLLEDPESYLNYLRTGSK